MGLTGKHELYRPALVSHDLQQTVIVMQKQISPFIGGEAAGKANRQGIRVQKDAAGNRLNGMALGGLPLAARPVDRKENQLSFEVTADAPELIIRNIFNLGPHIGIVNVIRPVRAHIAREQQPHLTGQPGFGVNAIGDRPDRHLIRLPIRPEVIPHLASHLPM